MNIGEGAGVENSGELYVMDYVIKKLYGKRPLTIFDVGANKGDYALTIAQKLQENEIVYCFEPSKNTFDLLVNNVRNKKNIVTFNFGFGVKNEFLTLFSDKPGSGMASVYKRRLDHFNTHMDLSEKIYLTTLDSFCKERGITHINLLKLDVEGHELNVLSGATDLINSQSIDFIQFEFGGCNIDSRTYFQDFFYFLNDKYKIWLCRIPQ
jgi:FkbM family methyltransferase